MKRNAEVEKIKSVQEQVKEKIKQKEQEKEDEKTESKNKRERERQKEKDRVAKKAKELEEKIKAERARCKSIEKKEEKDYYTYGYDDGSYEELCRLREERMKNLWRPENEFKEQLNGDNDDEGNNDKKVN